MSVGAKINDLFPYQSLDLSVQLAGYVTQYHLVADNFM